MTQTLIGIDLQKSIIPDIDLALTALPGRFKPLIGVFAGQGKGKTRLAEEIRRYIISTRYENTLPIAITFNKSSDFNTMKLRKFMETKAIKSAELASTICLVARMIRSIYPSYPLDYIAMKIADISIENHLGNSNMELRSLIVASINHMVYKVSLPLSGMNSRRNRENVILIVDETSQFQRETEKFIYTALNKNNSNNTNNDTLDLWSYCREALLGNEPKKMYKTALVMIGLTYEVASRTPSNRPVKVFQLPYEMNVARIINDWWKVVNLNLNTDDHRQKSVLSLIAATVNSTPRLVESIATVVLPSILDADGFVVRSKYSAIYDHVIGVVSGRYDNELPPWHLWHALLFQRSVPIDDPSLKACILSGLFSNHYPTVSITSSFVPTLRPRASWAMIAAAAESVYGCSINDNSDQRISIIRSIGQSLASLPARKVNDLGTVLEDIDGRMMQLRILAKIMLPKKHPDRSSCRIGDLLGITMDGDLRMANDQVYDLLSKLIIIPTLGSDLIIKDATFCLSTYQVMEQNGGVSDDEQLFAELLEDITDRNDSISLIRMPKGEACDWLLVLYTAEGKKPIFIMKDNKSKHMINTHNAHSSNKSSVIINPWTINMKNMPDNGSQYKHMSKVVQKIVNMRSKKKDGLRRMINSKNFLYLYAFSDQPHSMTVKGNPLVYIGLDDTAKFFTILNGPYQAMRQFGIDVKQTK